MSKVQRGFTLIELIVVIVILGILAATALPRFINLTGEAKSASMKGLAGGMRGAVELVRGKWYAVGSLGATTVTMADSTLVTVGTAGTAAGVPVGSAAGIGNALGSLSGYTPTFVLGGTSTFTPVGGPPGCIVSYSDLTGVVTETAVAATDCD